MDYDLVECETLDEFWRLISPVGDIFDVPGASFIYRGQSNSAWELIPSVYRKDVLLKYKKGMMSVLKDHIGHFFFEWHLLSSFIDYCDSVGLAIPNDSMEFRDYFSQDNITTVHGINTRAWPQDRAIPLMALAQHHRIPTRLLDWSNNPYIASYFAAASAINEKLGSNEKIALFGIDKNRFSRATGLRHVRVPGSTSANLSSQGGSFVLVDNTGNRGDDFELGVSLESKSTFGIFNIIKITLPKALAGDLLLRCSKFGFSAASIFPGYDGAARAVLEATLAFNFNK